MEGNEGEVCVVTPGVSNLKALDFIRPTSVHLPARHPARNRRWGTRRTAANAEGLVAGSGIREGAGDEHGIEEAVAVGDVRESLVTGKGTGIDSTGAVERCAVGGDGLGPVGNVGELIVEETERVVIGGSFGGDAGVGDRGENAVVILAGYVSVDGHAIGDHSGENTFPFANVGDGGIGGASEIARETLVSRRLRRDRGAAGSGGRAGNGENDASGLKRDGAIGGLREIFEVDVRVAINAADGERGVAAVDHEAAGWITGRGRGGAGGCVAIGAVILWSAFLLAVLLGQEDARESQGE